MTDSLVAEFSKSIQKKLGGILQTHLLQLEIQQLKAAST